MRIWTTIKAWYRSAAGNEPPSSAPEASQSPMVAIQAPGREQDDPPSSYSTDLPIQSSTQDRFSRALFAQRIAETIAHRTDNAGLVLGLYGPWGDGKTSVLHMIEEHLSQRPSVVVTRFNPWQFTSEDQLLRGFFGTLAAAIGERLTSRAEEIGEALKKYGSLLSVVNGGDAATGLGEALSTTSLDQLKARVEQFLTDGQVRVVVLIDDIDRLDRSETHLIFKLVKLSAGFSRTTYLLAFDDAVVAAALGERYGAGGDASGRAFLEKIIQVPLHLPSVESGALRRLVFEGLNQALALAGIELTQEESDAFVIRFGYLEASMTTPRQAHLYANALLFSLPLVKGEVNISEFMLLEALRLFHPALHRALQKNASLLLSERDRDYQQREQQISQLIEKATPELTAERRKRLTSGVLQALFPRIGQAGYGGEWERTWAREQRVCASSYFHKFFAYGTSTSELSDRRLQQFLDDLPTQSPSEQDAALQSLATPDTAGPFVQRLRQREDHLPAAVAGPLALLLARNGALFPYERGPFSSGGAFTQAGIVIYFLLRTVPDGESRYDLARELLRVAEPLPFAAECLRWMFPSPRREPEERVFEEADFSTLRALFVAERVMPSDMREPLYRQFGRGATMVYDWWHDVDATGLTARLEECVDLAGPGIDEFLDMFVGEAWEMGTNISRRSDLDRHSYDHIAQLVSPDWVAQRLQARYGAELDNPRFHHDREIALPLRFAHQFAFVHAQVSSARAGEPEDQSLSEESPEDE